MASVIRPLEKLMTDAAPSLDPWNLKNIMSDECLSYVAWNKNTKEALIVDPKKEDLSAYLSIAEELKGYRWLGIVDTHTHADHISVAFDLAQTLQAPVIMHSASVTPRVHVKISRSTALPSAASPIQILLTPGHTPDSLTVLWGPFIFGGDTILFGDVGRDDLPGGSPEAHYESVQLVKKHAQPEMILLPGHDHKSGRASTWKHQLEINTSLSQSRTDFIAEATAFNGAAPKLLKESLRENFK